MSIAEETVGEEFAISRRLRAQREADRKRNARKRPVRASTLGMRHSKAQLFQIGAILYPHEEHPEAGHGAPKTRAECGEKRRDASGKQSGCPYVSCRHNLYLDVNENGSIKLNFPDLEPHELKESCALDVAARGGTTQERVGELMNLTRVRGRQIELGALQKIYRKQVHSIEEIRRAFALDEGLDPAKARVRLKVIK